MALPVTVISAAGVVGYQPPVKSSKGEFYCLVVSGNAIDAYKATDPTSSFTVQDASNNPAKAGSSTFNAFTYVQAGDTLYGVNVVTTSSGDVGYYHVKFYLDTDLWEQFGGNSLETIELPTNSPTNPWASIAIRSDGDVIVAYAGDTDQVMGGKKERVDYGRREGGTWTVGLEIDAAGDVHYGNPNIVKAGLTDDMRIVWQGTSSTVDPPVSWTGLEARTLDFANSLSTLVTNAGDTASTLLGICNMVGYEDAGTARTAFLGGLVTWSINAWRATDDGSGDIQAPSNAVVTTQDIYSNGEVSILSIAEDSGVLYVLFSGGGVNGADQDIYYSTSTDDGETWTNPTEELDAVTCNYISCSIMQIGALTVLAYIYDDGGTQKFNYRDLSLEITYTQLDHATMEGLVNTHVGPFEI